MAPEEIKASCFDRCEFQHQCYIMWVGEQSECDDEINRISKALQEQCSSAKFLPSPSKGLRFLCKDDNGQHDIILEDGYIQIPEGLELEL